MRKKIRNCCWLALLCILLLPGRALAQPAGLTEMLEQTARYVQRAVPAPQLGSIGGEWAVLGLARSGVDVPQQYFDDYYAAVSAQVAALQGQLHEKKYTEYSRLIVALTAIGVDVRDVAGYDLLLPLGDFENTVWQGLNGPVWALIALDSGAYAMPSNAAAATPATRELYLQYILDSQRSDGGFALDQAAAEADADITAMALQALAPYRAQAAVEQAVQRALSCLGQVQQTDGGFANRGEPNFESTAQVVMALCALGVTADDARFVKAGGSVWDNLLAHYQPGQGFVHSLSGGGDDLMATEQGLCALVALQRAEAGLPGLYQMTDVQGSAAAPAAQQAGSGLPGKHAAVQAPALSAAAKTFDDIQDDTALRQAVEALAARGVIGGKSETQFAPADSVTRAEYAVMVVRGLGLPLAAGTDFADVEAAAWYAPYVGAAAGYGVVSGRSAAVFDPEGLVSREEAALMTARAAALAGMDTALPAAAVRDVLAQFDDYVQSAAWAREALAFCYRQGILDDSAVSILPQQPATRGEIAAMLYQLLQQANLLTEVAP